MDTADAPAVEMLWEDVEPGDALMSRFGFASAREASDWILELTRLRWGLDVQSCERVAISDRNALAWLDGPSGSVVAKWSAAEEKFERLDALARVVAWLGQRGVAVSAPIPATDGEVQIEADGLSLAMQRAIRGEILDPESPDQVRAAGATLARMHAELATYPDPHAITCMGPQPGPLLGTIRNWMDADRPHVPDAVLSELQSAISLLDCELPVPIKCSMATSDARTSCGPDPRSVRYSISTKPGSDREWTRSRVHRCFWALRIASGAR